MSVTFKIVADYLPKPKKGDLVVASSRLEAAAAARRAISRAYLWASRIDRDASSKRDSG